MFPGIDPNTQTFLLWALAILVMAWTWIPALVSALGGTRLSHGLTSQAAGSDQTAGPDEALWANQLTQLGYEPIGAGWLRVNFAGSEWALYTPVRVFRNASANIYAFMQKAPAPFHFWPGAVFATCWSDGVLLLTDNNSNAEPDFEDEFIRQGIVTLNLADIETIHRNVTEAMIRSGRRPDSDSSPEALFLALQRYLGPEAKRAHGRAGTQYLFVHILIHLCASMPSLTLVSLTHWSLPFINLILALILGLGESSHKRQYARAVRAAFRNEQIVPKGEGS